MSSICGTPQSWTPQTRNWADARGSKQQSKHYHHKITLSPCAVESFLTPGDIRGGLSPGCALSGLTYHAVYTLEVPLNTGLG